MDKFYGKDYIFLYIYIIFLSLFSVTATVSSTLVLCCVRYNKHLHTPQNIIVVAVAVADLAVGTLLMPLDIVTSRLFLEHIQTHSPFVCLISNFVLILLKTAELLFIALLCLDIFVKVNFPNFYRRKINKKKICMLILGICIRQTIVAVTAVFYDRAVETWCSSMLPAWVIEGLGLIFIIVGCVILLLCSQLAYLSRKKPGLVRKIPQSVTLVNRLVFAYLLFNIPIFVSYVYGVYNDYKISQIVKDFMRLLNYLQPVTNGVVLAMSSSVYEKSFKFLLTTNPMHWKEGLSLVTTCMSEPVTCQPSEVNSESESDKDKDNSGTEEQSLATVDLSNATSQVDISLPESSLTRSGSKLWAKAKFKRRIMNEKRI